MRLFLAAGFGCLAMAFFVISQWPWMLFGFFGLVPWLAALERAKGRGQALLAGSMMALAYVLGVGYWIPSMIHAFTGIPWFACVLLTILGAPLIQPQFVAYALARHWTGEHRIFFVLPAAPLAAAFAFVAVDWAFPKLFSDTLGDNLHGAIWLRQTADLVGALGLSFLLLVVNECLFAIWKALRHPARAGLGMVSLKPAAALVLLLAIPSLYGALRYQQLENQHEARTTLNYAMLQAGFSHFGTMAQHYGGYLVVRTVLDTHIAMSRQALTVEPVDVVIWPENVYPLSFGQALDEQAERLDERIRELVVRSGVPLLFGARDREGEDWFNAAFLLQPGATEQVQVDVYRKASLFPFVEFTPSWLRLDASWLGTYSRGPGPVVLDLQLQDQKTLKVLPLICYDALFPGHVIRGVRQGADVLLTLSNDSWFEYGNTPRIILNGSAFRSIETRRPQLRTTVTGISAVISPTGEIIDQLGTGEVGTLVGTIESSEHWSLMLLLGNWFGPTSALAVMLLLLSAHWSQVRKKQAAELKNSSAR
ncbi:MAG: apolipoprotein N-acyltransferase [Wenzhouxiangella sp.]|nr:apolipoprotein N-acyltransferase [Wenzhouxiangella sp.]